MRALPLPFVSPPHQLRCRPWAFVAVLGLVTLAGLLAALPVSAISTHTVISPTGTVSEDRFGISVASAGDLNADGHDDVIVGAYLDDTGGTDAGAAFVFFGGPGQDDQPDLTLLGAAAGDKFGRSVASAGDMNGDGYHDVIVGAIDGGATSLGTASVFHGGPSMDTTADFTVGAGINGEDFGFSVSSAGDMNGDGYDDVLIGDNRRFNDAGAAYVYFGGPTVNYVVDLTMTGAAGDQFGFAVASAGDTNGDGYDDILIGAPFNDAGGADAGRAYLYLGSPSPDNIADVTLTGETAGDGFGISVASAGDMNADGFGDLLVGAYHHDGGGTDAGRSYVYFGGLWPDGGADVVVTGTTAGGLSGRSVSSGGDINGDGYGDVLVGAYLADDGGTDFGSVSVYFGGSTPDAVADIVLAGNEANAHYGYSVSSAGDANSDGHDDILVGAYLNDTASPNAGRVFLTTAFPFQVLTPNGGETWVAGRVATVRWRGHDRADLDLSTDGGATWTMLESGIGGSTENAHSLTVPTLPTHAARVRLRYAGQAAARATSDASDETFRIALPESPPAPALRRQITVTGTAAGDGLGGAVAGSGDFNGDGHSDFLAAAQLSDAGGVDFGAVYLFYGGPVADAVADHTFVGTTTNEGFGSSVAFAGDVNGDGFDDVVIGEVASSIAGTNFGAAHLYLGGASPDTTADAVYTGQATWDAFGIAVSPAGDVNGDGYADVLVGAGTASGLEPGSGAAYVYFGGVNPDTTADLTFLGESASGQFGFAVASAGDVDGDGFDDILIGAPQAIPFGGGPLPPAGRAYLFRGGSTPDAVADLTIDGVSGDLFGAVAGIGDFNGDGFDDFAVGASGADAPHDLAGAVRVFFGGTLDSYADLVLEGSGPFERFGSAVAPAGDVNRDGFDDLLVGSTRDSPSGSGEGLLRVFLGGRAADDVADFTFSGDAAGDRFGLAAAAAGDVNGDGFGDLVIGALSSDVGGSNAGRAYLYDGARYFLTSPSGGETWNVGARETVTWLGGEPADILLSADGGATYDLLLSHVGGRESNSVEVLVPHLPTRFARLAARPSNPALPGEGASDSLFTVQASIALLGFQARAQGGTGAAAVLSWETDPGPEDLAGYRLEKASGAMTPSGAPGWRTVVSRTRETSWVDTDPGSGSRYRLSAVNGLGQEYVVGETAFGAGSALGAWPLPYRGGELTVSFATAGGLGAGPGRALVSLHDVSGRRLRTLVDGEFEQGFRHAAWDGRDASGRPVASGIYFLRAVTGGESRSLKLVVVR